MSAQLSLAGIAQTEPTPVAGAERFAECRRRVAAGCGGRHVPGQMWRGSIVARWVCCDGCEHRAELNPWSAPS